MILVWALLYSMAGLALGYAIYPAMKAGKMRWYNLLAGSVLWPITLLWGVLKAYREIRLERMTR